MGSFRRALNCLILLAGCGIATAYSTDRNVWQEGGFYFAIGLSDDPSEIKAREDSCSSAKRELIGFLFGVKVKVDQKVTSTLSDITLSENVSISSDSVKLIGTATEISKQGDITKCVLKYSNLEALAEKRRIESMAKTLKNQKLNKATFENSDPTHFGVVTIKTNVKDAKLFLDSVLFGKTPIEIDRVSVGKHTLILEAVGYKSLTQLIDIALGERKNLFLPLERNLSVLDLQVLPESAKALTWIDGIQRGSERHFMLEPGSRVLRVEADYFFPSQDHVLLDAGQTLKHVVTLVPKKVHVTFLSKSQKARVFLAGALVGETTVEKELEPGHYAIQFISDNKGIFSSQEIEVKPGKPLQVVADEKSSGKQVGLKQAPVMVYSDLSLSKGMGYSNETDPPPHSANTSPVHIILDGPSTGFISIDGKLAGIQKVIIDKVDRAFTVKVEAPGYYPDEIRIGTLPNERNLHCEYLDRDPDDKQEPCPASNLLRANEIVVDPYSGADEYVTIHPYKIVPQPPDMPLASIVLIPKEGFSYSSQAGILSAFPINSEFYLDWLKARFRGMSFSSQVKKLNSIMYMTIPGSVGRIPAAVVYGYEVNNTGPKFLEINVTGSTSGKINLKKIFEKPSEFASECTSYPQAFAPCAFEVRGNMDGIEVAPRVIVILDAYKNSSFPTASKDISPAPAPESVDSKRYSR